MALSWLVSSIYAQEIPMLDMMYEDTSVRHKLLPSGIPDELNCQCPRHVRARSGMMPSGVAVLDSLPDNAEVIKQLRLTDIASSDSLDNTGYKRFYAMIQLKSMALDCGANALVHFAQTVQGDSLIFTATAIRIEKK